MHAHQYAQKEKVQAVPAGELEQQAEAGPEAPSPAARALLDLQRRRGNHYVQQVIGELHPKQALNGRLRLRLGRPGDRYEREADRAAAQVVRSLGVAATPHAEPGRPGLVRLKAGPGAGAVLAGPPVQAAIEGEQGRGSPLPDELRERMEGAFAADFGRVRLHTDEPADRLSQTLHAQAFTTGQEIFFRRGAYQPSSPGGIELLAHELAHVVQQQGDLIQGYELREINDPVLIPPYDNAHYRYDDDPIFPDEYLHISYRQGARDDNVVRYYYNVRTGLWRKWPWHRPNPATPAQLAAHQAAAIAWANPLGLAARAAALAPAPAPVPVPAFNLANFPALVRK